MDRFIQFMIEEDGLCIDLFGKRTDAYARYLSHDGTAKAWISKITNNWILYNKSYVAYIYTRYEYTTKAIRQSTTADEPSSMPYALSKISYT